MAPKPFIQEINKVAQLGTDEKPFVVKTESGKTVLEPFMLDLTREEIFMMGSDKILTLAIPTPTLLEQYLNLIKE